MFLLPTLLPTKKMYDVDVVYPAFSCVLFLCQFVGKN